MSARKISILVLNEAVPASIVDPSYMFSAVNQFFKEAGKGPAFEIQLVGLSRDVPLNRGAFSVRADALLDEVEKTDLVIVPALSGDIGTNLELNKDFIPWIVRQHANGAEVASLCLGAFLLAATGLLNGKECSTHWLFADEFRRMFPEVRLVDGRIISDEQGLYSSGGASSYWNLLLHIIEKYTDRTIAIRASKFFAIEIDRKTQSPFIMFQGQKKHEDEPIKQAQDFIENNVGERISVEDLALKYAIGRRHFERRFKKATNNTPVEYIQRVKIEAAKKLLENSAKNVTEVMYEVGYTDVKAFRTIFRRITGLSPMVYRNKYNRMAAV
ncbi:AraC family transcriptional regulator with amidase-like domain [Anseongella ginsenosidimutans]|uniref:AraC family transcriptional regulator with amidase-like domain n=1 Tax=Anseongella ginsenosidimutans TaxID=496056 RepID=A0A4R3L142_9SPHI|nr:helix-turn-helix domain-containing protein [Anseongella ginsenosidimutans]QEC51205.1 helix-turn-helix domain-containing protein [Anseongella ginsenosidimutans]TCS90122.1 AraC family transcriptional regulator with amidase-like domain [Anseongella ginsenosidimutans]